MDEQVIRRILSQYGYPEVKLLALEKGYRNESHPFQTSDGNVMNFILYKCESGILRRIQNADRTADFAARAGLPARQTADNRIVRLQAGAWQKYGVLYRYLPGNTIPWEAYTMEHIKLLGKTLSDLHATLHALPPTGYPAAADEYSHTIEHMHQYFEKTGVVKAINAKLGLHIDPDLFSRFPYLLAESKRLKQQQVLHMDFVRSNILFSDDPKPVITGILDFEKTAYGHPIFDIARTLAFLLVDCKYKTVQQVHKYFLYSGYQKRGSQTLPHVRLREIGGSGSLLDELVNLFLLYDLYKFLRHNPYESLLDNEHYRRTKDLLLARGLISANKMVQ